MSILLPKIYLSWSQMEIWESNPARYRREYFENGKKLDTKYLQFGKGIAKLVEELCEIQITKSCTKEEAIQDLVAVHSLDFNTVTVLRELDTEGIGEFEIKGVEVRGVPFLSFIDKYKDSENCFREYKTGKNPWTLAKVQKHGQLLFYATALKAKTGKMPEYCELDWLETSDTAIESDDFWAQVDKKLSLTGKVKTFHRDFDPREIDKMEDRIEKVAREISEAYQLFIKEL